jgi:hypothetical protein
MLTSFLSARTAAVSAVGAGIVTGAMLFGGTPTAQAAPPPAPGTSFDMAGPHGAPGVPLGPGGGGGGHGGWGGGGHSGWGRGGGWGGHGDWGRGGGWGGHPGWGNGGWGPPGFGYRPWWSWWW